MEVIEDGLFHRFTPKQIVLKVKSNNLVCPVLYHLALTTNKWQPTFSVYTFSAPIYSRRRVPERYTCKAYQI